MVVVGLNGSKMTDYSQIIRASDVGFIDKDTAKKLYNDTLNLSKSISKFITSLKESSITGLKNK